MAPRRYNNRMDRSTRVSGKRGTRAPAGTVTPNERATNESINNYIASQRTPLPSRSGPAGGQSASFAPYEFTPGLDIDLSPALTSEGGIWAGIGSPSIAETVTDDNKTIGGTGIRLANSTLAGVQAVAGFGMTAFDLNTTDCFAVWFWCDFSSGGLTNVVRLSVSTDTFAANSVDYIEADFNRGLKPGWNCIKFPPLTIRGAAPYGYRGASASNTPMSGWQGDGNFVGGETILNVRVEVLTGTNYTDRTHELIFGGVTYGYKQPGVFMLCFDDARGTIIDQASAFDTGNGMGEVTVIERIQMWNQPGSWNGNQPIKLHGSIAAIRDFTGPQVSPEEYDQILPNSGESIKGSESIEVITHGQAPIKPVGQGGVFTTAFNAVNDGYPDGVKVEGDGMRYNQQYAIQNGGNAQEARGYVLPTNYLKAGGNDWYSGVTAEADPYFDFLGTSSPSLIHWDILPQGRQTYSWGQLPRWSGENAEWQDTYQTMFDNLIDDHIPNIGAAVCIYLHNILPTVAADDIPTNNVDIHKDKAAQLIDAIAAVVMAGRAESDKMSTFYYRMVASGAGTGL